jgi:hypothetical protein
MRSPLEQMMLLQAGNSGKTAESLRNNDNDPGDNSIMHHAAAAAVEEG